MKTVTVTDKLVEDITNWHLEICPNVGVDGWVPFVAASVRNALECLPNDFAEQHMLLAVLGADVIIGSSRTDWPDQKAQLFAQLMINGQTGEHKLYSTREVPVNDDYEARMIIAEAKELYDTLDGEDPVSV